MVGTKSSGQPGGNPNIAKVKNKPGPKTFEGKLKNKIMGGGLVTGRCSKLMKIASKCNFCPLRTRTEMRFVKGKAVEVVIPAQCKFYQKNKVKCGYPLKDQIVVLKAFFYMQKHGGSMELQKSLINQSIMDAEMARKAEVVIHGHPKFYTAEHMDRAMRHNSEIIKIENQTNVQKHLHVNVEGDLAKKILNRLGVGDVDEEE